ncbi:hypothetical protein [Rugamonas apoptosis]|uniref:Lipoprotein n=1 Tax=Rugamonas apoptosis TaxID=2758570 RepID=A0A7W2F6H1_9BURK|nr:hypothetical protein [Rugamonas apoptosis]MBA5685959.1 hypothetical protein [Rugamonas apoptosis]
MKKLSLILMLALSACGGSGGGGGNGDGAGGPSPVAAPPPSVVDTFVTALLALVSDSGDSTEPAAVDTLAATAPEDSEPAPVK